MHRAVVSPALTLVKYGFKVLPFSAFSMNEQSQRRQAAEGCHRLVFPFSFCFLFSSLAAVRKCRVAACRRKQVRLGEMLCCGGECGENCLLCCPRCLGGASGKKTRAHEGEP